MPDLDALIREDLNDDVLLSCSGGDHVDHTHYQATVNALRDALATLDRIENRPPAYGVAGHYIREGSRGAVREVRSSIARALGVSE